MQESRRMERRRLDAQTAAEWQKVIRDAVITALAAFTVIFEVAFKENPNAYALGTAVTLLGVPPALRLDQRRRDKRLNGNGGTAHTSQEDDDRPVRSAQ